MAVVFFPPFLITFLIQFLCGLNPAAAASPFPLFLSLQISAAQLPPNKLSFRRNVSLTVTISVGSPPQQVTMVLDTGSELSWLRCVNTTATAAALPSYNPRLFSTYRPIPCSAATCIEKTLDLTLPVSCDGDNLCHAIVSYADASSAEGNLAEDDFHLAGSVLDRTVFGCMGSWSSSNPAEDSKSTGLIGMNRGTLSFISQMGFPQFSYCISDNEDSAGVLLLGDADLLWLGPLNYTPLVRPSTPLPYFDRSAYTVRLQGIRVSATDLPLPKSVFEPDHTGAGQTMLDSGTQFSFLLGPVYTVLKNEFLKQTTGILRPLGEPDFVFQGAMDLCYRIELSRAAALPPLPSVTLVLPGAEMKVSGEKLLYRVPEARRGGDGVYCLSFGNSELLGVEAYVIGQQHQQNFWMEFDLVNSRVGLAEVKCDLANQRLGLGHHKKH